MTAYYSLMILCLMQAPASAPDSYLGQMPTARRVRDVIKGSTSVDTAARQLGALWQLEKLIYDMAAAEHRDRNHVTPEEKHLGDEYMDTYVAIREPMDRSLPDQQQRAFYTLHRRYEFDKSLRDTLFRTFFTSSVRASIYQALGEKAPPTPVTPTDANRAKTSPIQSTTPKQEVGQSAELKAIIKRADALRLAKEYSPAIELYKRAIGLDSESGQLYLSLAICYWHKDEWQLMVPALKRVIQLVQPNQVAQNMLGLAYLRLKQYDNALDAFHAALKQKAAGNGVAEANRFLGETYIAMKEYDRAIPLCANMI